jgi:3-phosphoshikimate 1-carboxyvinyltransferase
MAMCFGMLGVVVPGMKIRNPSCVNKTFPDFFEKLKAVGAGIRE